MGFGHGPHQLPRKGLEAVQNVVPAVQLPPPVPQGALPHPLEEVQGQSMEGHPLPPLRQPLREVLLEAGVELQQQPVLLPVGFRQGNPQQLRQLLQQLRGVQLAVGVQG